MYCINYVIKNGDTLYKISRQFNVGISEIMSANPMINVYNLMVDQVICIPISSAMNAPLESPISTPMKIPMDTPMKKPMDTPMDTPMDNTLQGNIPMDNTNFTTYLVENDDTLGSIVEKSDIDLGDILTLNGLNEIYLLPGSTIRLPIGFVGESGVRF